jgi:Sec-independent protein translocase protein TatA
MEEVTIILGVIFDSIMSLVSSMTLIEFCLLISLTLLVTISRRLGSISKAVQEIKGAADEVLDVVESESQENTEKQRKAELQRKAEPQKKIDPKM